MPRVAKLLLVAGAVVLVALVATLYVVVRHGGNERENVVNDGLRGSTPPQDQAWPGDLASVRGVDPRFPVRTPGGKGATMLVATCIECRSGAVIGGFLGRLASDDLPDGARLVVLTWEGDPAAWRTAWAIDRGRTQWYHATTAEAAHAVRSRLGIGSVGGAEESGVTLLYDTAGTWRASYSIGQLDREDIAHDLRRLSM